MNTARLARLEHRAQVVLEADVSMFLAQLGPADAALYDELQQADPSEWTPEQAALAQRLQASPTWMALAARHYFLREWVKQWQEKSPAPNPAPYSD